MLKSPEAFRTISEVAETLDVPPHVLRFWETRFAQVKPVKRGGGRRYYRPEDVRLLRGIRGLLYDDGMTIKGVQKILRERGVRHVIGLGTVAEGGDPARPPRAYDPATFPGDDLETGAMDDDRLNDDELAGEDDDLPYDSDTGNDGDEDMTGGDHDAIPSPFAPDAPAPAESPTFPSPAPGTAPEKPASLRDLVTRLEALRAVMTGNADR